MNEYRCTRNDPYRTERTMPLSGRQGYYIRATTEAEALDRMAERFPTDRQGFTVELWKENLP